ncbi:MAG: ATP-dependent DNA helicase RecG [Planctomycetota bacterium]|nr:ATP-dependent DNA helicase RecG [Planctomycetota bacterium]MDA1178304.1 ATP-dependent DNA helicase RecG [Planctomycetota bacterium]
MSFFPKYFLNLLLRPGNIWRLRESERPYTHMNDSKEMPSPITISSPLHSLPGVGPARAALLARLDLQSLQDLLFYFPRDYQTVHRSITIGELRPDEMASIDGEVTEIELRGAGTGKSILGVLIRQENAFLRAIWFNQPYLAEKYQVGQRLQLTGKPRKRGLRWEMNHPQVVPLDDGYSAPDRATILLPVYRLTEGVQQNFLRPLIARIVCEYAEIVPETLPAEIIERHSLASIGQALRGIHVPQDDPDLARAKRRFVFQELLVMQLALAMKRHRQQLAHAAPKLPNDRRIDGRIRRLLPFPLTSGQEQVIQEICADLAQDVPMQRLLHGEVGSGKTIVAVYAMLLATVHGYQAAMMTPTEILARQHMLTLQRLLKKSRVRLQLLTGGMTAVERRNAADVIREGNVDLIVGTQAIVLGELEFAKLGLVVIDEQHKFGVQQRATLKQASLDPHYLVMTATPIPRTIAMTTYGDLDTSTLRGGPPGRQPVHTYWGTSEQRERWWQFVANKLREGRQAYVIAPMVDGNDDELATVEAVYESLVHGPLESFRVDIVHGRMSANEKELAMTAFREGKTQVLIATSVVEVGIDVPNAILMTIENAERFGLAQLHQLRGRVSRGPFSGYVCAFTGDVSDEGRQRLEAFVRTNDGFELAEIDLQLRGPGDLFGTRQHGMAPLRIADLREDDQTLQETRLAASDIIQADPELQQAGFERLRAMVLRRYGEKLALSQVG